MKEDNEKFDWIYYILLAIILIGIGFGLGALIRVNSSNVDLNQTNTTFTDFDRGYLTAYAEINNQMVRDFINYGQYKSQVIYENQTYPIVCQLVQG